MIDTITSDELKDILLNGTPETIKKVITNIHPADILDILHEDEDSIKALMLLPALLKRKMMKMTSMIY